MDNNNFGNQNVEKRNSENNIEATKGKLLKQIEELKVDKKYIKNKELLSKEKEKLSKVRAKIRDYERDIKYHEALIDNISKIYKQLGGE